MQKPTLGMMIDAQEAGARFAGSGDTTEWADAHLLSVCTGLPVPQIRELPYRTIIAIKEELYKDDPVNVMLRVSDTEPPWSLTRCTCCSCVFICVDHASDSHTDECPQEIILHMRRIITDDVIYSSDETGLNTFRLLTRVSDKDDTSLRAIPHYYYWTLRIAVTRSMNDPLWPSETDPQEQLRELGLLPASP